MELRCGAVFALQQAVVGFALIAAIFWFVSAWRSMNPLTRTPMEVLDKEMKAASIANAIAAMCAGFSALAQVILLTGPSTCPNPMQLW